WIYAVTFSVAVLAGLGADQHTKPYSNPSPNSGKDDGEWSRRLPRRLGYALLILGALTLIGLLVSYVFYAQVEPLAQWILDNMVTASGEPARVSFADARMFYSYQFTNVLTLGVMLLGAGAVFLWANPTRRLWQVFAVGLVALDLM